MLWRMVATFLTYESKSNYSQQIFESTVQKIVYAFYNFVVIFDTKAMSMY